MPAPSTRARSILSCNSPGSKSTAERLLRFVPFDPATKSSEAFIIDRDGTERRIVNGAFEVIAKAAELPANARYLVDSLAGQGHRVAA